MHSASCPFLVSFLAIVLGVKPAEAIKCYQCSDCRILPALEECSRVTLLDASAELGVKMEAPDLSGEEYAYAVEQARSTLERLLPQANSPPGSCFKLSATAGNRDVVYRGCNIRRPGNACIKTPEGVSVCVCQGDGCNSAKIVLSSTIFIVCMSFFSAVLNV